MPAFVMLPGERVEATLRPTPWSYTTSYLRAASAAVFGAILWIVFRADWWALHEPGPWTHFWTFLYGNAPMAYVFLWLGVVVGATAFAWSLGRAWWRGAALGGLIALAVTGATAAWSNGATAASPGLAYETTIPWLLAGASLLGFALLELDRHARTIAFTNVRLVAHGGLWEKWEHAARYEDIADIDVEQSAWGKLLGFGTLVPVMSPHAKEDEGVAIAGIRPVKQGRELLTAMVQHATASAELKKAGDTESRLYRALRHFRRPQD